MNDIQTMEKSRELVAESLGAGILSDKHIQARVNVIQGAIKNIFKKDVHFGVIPGTQKPTLYKPGAEQLMVMFRIAPDAPKIEDLSTPDSIRYRVTRGGVSQINGSFLGAGVGECSSDEEKYKWRKPVCDGEYDSTPEDRKRLVWKKSFNVTVQIKQVRTSPADVANTVLKMADKRALVAMVLVTTGASDAFNQDIEDLPEEIRESVVEGEKPPPIQQPSSTPTTQPIKKEPKTPGAARVISDPQRNRFYAIWKNAGKMEATVKSYLIDKIGSQNDADIPVDLYDEVCAWAAAK